jgi:hypothetical protein
MTVQAPGVPAGGATGLLMLIVPVNGKQVHTLEPLLKASLNDAEAGFEFPVVVTNEMHDGDPSFVCAMVQLVGPATPSPVGPL